MSLKAYSPRSHARQNDRSSRLNSPSSQASQSLMLLWYSALVESSSLYVPAGHSVQLLDPSTLLYVPTPQMVQFKRDVAPRCAEDVPAAQSSQISAPSSAEYLPISHVLHESSACTSWYLPTSQSLQVVLSSQCLPLEQF